MILTKYRMILDNGYIETLDEQEAVAHGNYIIVEEEIEEDGANIDSITAEL